MELSGGTQKFLHRFKSWRSPAFVYPSGRFLISYRKTSDLAMKAVTEGWVRENPPTILTVNLGTPSKSSSASSVVTSEECEAYIQKATSGKAITRFLLTEEEVAICKVNGTTGAGVEIWLTEGERNIEIPGHSSEPIRIMVGGQAAKVSFGRLAPQLIGSIPKGEYWVTIINNGYIVLESLDFGFSIYSELSGCSGASSDG